MSNWIYYNPSPVGRNVGDCSVRAIAKALNTDWETAFALTAMNGYLMGDMQSSDSVLGAVLRQHGFKREAIPNTCPDCFTADDFCRTHPDGTYVLFFGGHVACVQSGKLFDSWDSSGESPAYYWYKKEE